MLGAARRKLATRRRPRPAVHRTLKGQTVQSFGEALYVYTREALRIPRYRRSFPVGHRYALMSGSKTKSWRPKCSGSWRVRSMTRICGAIERACRRGLTLRWLSPGYGCTSSTQRESCAKYVSRKGWPRKTDIGSKGMSALWRIIQHAIADPDHQRRLFAPLTTAR